MDSPHTGSAAGSIAALATASGGSRPRSFSKASESLARGATKTRALEKLRHFLRTKDGPLLRVWFLHFDRQQAGKIDHRQFRDGMASLRFPGDADELWSEINFDATDDLFLEEVDPEHGAVWNDFRRWCGSRFHSPRDMLRAIKRAATEKDPETLRGTKEVLTEQELVNGLAGCGWDKGYEQVLFEVLDTTGEGGVASRDLRWLELDVSRHQLKEAARRRARKISEQKARNKRLCAHAFEDFKAFLRKQYGPLFRAWRRVLDPDGGMTLQRAELFKVCRQLNWQGNMRSLWKALDHDGSGQTTFEELDPPGAKLLAEFQGWAQGIWGPKPAIPMITDMNRQGKRKLLYAEFARECEVRGFPFQKAIAVAANLDYRTNKYLQEQDVVVLDMWHPPAWLVASPNPEAAEEFKLVLFKKYGHFVRAWRMGLDRDNTNSCGWQDFCEAAKRLKFTGDIAGAWCTFDSELTGFISLKELDPVAHQVLTEFKVWADEEFGGVRAAFKTMDVNKSKHISFREFRSACRTYGFGGDVYTLFESLDQQGNKHILQFDEVSFLDDWDISNEQGVQRSLTDDSSGDGADSKRFVALTGSQLKARSPGPGSYEVAEGLTSGPTTPMVRHNGGCTFGTRLRRAWSKPRVGPDKYDPHLDAVKQRKPAWAFGDSAGPPPVVFSRAVVVPAPEAGGRLTPRPASSLDASPGSRLPEVRRRQARR